MNEFAGPFDSCPIHQWRPPRGPGGGSAGGLCPGCTTERDLASGRTELNGDGIPRPRRPGRVVREHGIVGDGAPVGERETPLEDRLWAEHLSQEEDRRRVESYALIRIEELREAERRRQNPRKRRVQFSKYENGEHVVIYAPDRRRRFAVDYGDGFEVE